MPGGTNNEKPKPLGDRVYQIHRDMLEEIGKKHSFKKRRGMKGADVIRYCIEQTYEREIKPSSTRKRTRD